MWTSLSDFVPVHTIFPFPNIRNVAPVSSLILNTRPGNCSGSYSTFVSLIAISFKSSFMSMSEDATTFSILIFGLILISMSTFLMYSISFWIAWSTSSSDFVPVHTTFPDENIRNDALGSLIFMIRPGNCSGLYSVFGKSMISRSRGILCSSDVEITMFTIFVFASFIFFITCPLILLLRPRLPGLL